MTVLGNLILVVALCTSLAAVLMYVRAQSVAKAVSTSPRFWVWASALSLIAASLVLLKLILSHDFSNGYVFGYSSRSLPLHFLISSFYAGQEGSFLFWALCSALLSLMLMRYAARKNSEAPVLAVFMGVQSFLVLLVLAKSPFKTVWEMYTQVPMNTIPPDGRGLNPLLQNFWMVVHPPVLFLGFAAMAIPFSFTIASLWKKNYSLLSEQVVPWLLFAIFVLGLGIMLGAYWAYGVLGWGGYWGWDPVENSSLIPWITGVALVHTILAQRRTGKYVKTNFILAISSFFLVIYSTFLTRSGILGDASVHSFVDPGATVYWLLIAFLAIIGVTGGVLVFVRRGDLMPEGADVGMLNRESALGAGAIALALSALVILFGTSLPIFSKIRVEPSFYDATNLPIMIVLALLVGFSLYLQWSGDGAKLFFQRAWKSLGASLLISAVLSWLGVRDLAMLALAFSLVFALIVNVEIGWKIIRGDPRFLGGKLAHIGLAIFFLGVMSTGKYSTTKHLALPQGVPQEALGHTLTYVGYAPTPDGKFAFRVDVQKDGDTFQLSPIMFEAGEQGIMRNPDIASFLTKDFYISPVSLDQGSAEAGTESYTLQKGETVTIGEVKATFVKFDMGGHGNSGMGNAGGGMSVGSVLELTRGTAHETIIPKAVYEEDGSKTYESSRSTLVNATIQLVSMNVGMGSAPSAVTVQVQRPGTDGGRSQSLVVEASIKPYINLLWGGTIVMMLGFILSMFKHTKES